MQEGKRYEIVEGAARAFAEYGLRKTTVDDIVREAGVARATLYKYFETKEDVFEAVVSKEAGEMLEAVERAVAQASTTREKLRVALVTHTDMIRRKLNILRLMIDAAAQGRVHARPGMEKLRERVVRMYEAILAEGVTRGELAVEDAAATALVLVLLFKGLFMAVLAEAVGPERDTLVEGMLDIVMDGMRPRGETA